MALGCAANWDLLPSCYQALGGGSAKLLRYLVDLIGIEPMTSSMPWKRAPSCATGPLLEGLVYSRGCGDASQTEPQESGYPWTLVANLGVRQSPLFTRVWNLSLYSGV